MPPRPFPFALGIGTDICCISRIHALVTKKPGTQSLLPFVKKVLTIKEQDDFFHKFAHEETDMSKDVSRISRYLAGRLVADDSLSRISDSCLAFS